MKERSALPQRIISLLGILGLTLALTTMLPFTAVAQQAAPANQEATDPGTGDDELPPLPLSPIEKAERDGTTIRLSLSDVTKLALQNNIDIAIQDTNEQMAQQDIISAHGSYDPSLTSTLRYNTSKRANTNYASYADAPFSKSETASWNLSFSQSVKTGGDLTVNWDTSRSDNNSTFSLFTPQYSSSLSVQFTQPLWRNLRIDQSRSSIKLRNLDLKTSDSQFKQTVTSQIASIQQQYWDLVAAIRDYEIQRDSVRLAQISLRDNRKRVEVGTLAPIEITRSRYEVANREQMLNSREEMILQRMNSLRQSISSDRNNEIWSKVIIPTDMPDFREYRIDSETAIETALKNRPELEQSNLDLQKSNINLQVARNNRKWQVNLTAQFGSTGTSGPQSFQRDPITGEPILNPITGEPIPNVPMPLVGGLGNSYKTIFTEGFTNWSISFNIQVPIKNRQADAALANQEISRKRLVLQRKKQEQDIMVEIRNALQSLETNRIQVETAQLRKELALEQLDGEVKRFDAGLTENYRVLEEQQNLATAENNELTQLINYKKAVITLQRVMHTLLEYSDFEISKSAADHIPDLY